MQAFLSDVPVSCYVVLYITINYITLARWIDKAHVLDIHSYLFLYHHINIIILISLPFIMVYKMSTILHF